MLMTGRPSSAAANNAKLLRELDGVPTEQRGAFFICVLVLLQHADDPAPLIAEARWHGRILTEGRGTGGFGYNPVFLPEGYQQSVAEMDDALKNRLSHRGQALVKLHERLRELHHA
jgi:XTP/dITP diphosphohydrolase